MASEPDGEQNILSNFLDERDLVNANVESIVEKAEKKIQQLLEIIETLKAEAKGNEIAYGNEL